MRRINLRSITLYSFSLVIMYLAGVYFGTFLFVLFIMFLILPALSLVSFLVWASSVSCEQRLSRYTPVKGDVIDFLLEVRNRSILPVPRAQVGFAQLSDALKAEFAEFEVYLPPKGGHQTTHRIVCPYRGTYQIGVNSIRVWDQMRFFSFAKRVEPIKVTVYPRVLHLRRFAPVANDVEGSGRYSSAGLLPDTTLFHQLKEYRDGESIRHIYWKKYASTGKPYLKEYDRTKRAGVRIYFDARPADRWDVNRLEQEDASVEALVAIVRYLLERRVNTSVIAATDPAFRFGGDDLASFERFYQATTRLNFLRSVSPVELFRVDLAAGMLESQTCIFITHHADPRIFTVSDGTVVYDTIFLLNRAGGSKQLQAELDTFAVDARKKGRSVILLRSSESIMEDLTGHPLAFAPGGDIAVATGEPM